MIIGNFKKADDNSFRGVIRTLTLNLEVAIEPITNKTGEKMPDYRVTTGHTDLGADGGQFGRSRIEHLAFV